LDILGTRAINCLGIVKHSLRLPPPRHRPLGAPVSGGGGGGSKAMVELSEAGDILVLVLVILRICLDVAGTLTTKVKPMTRKVLISLIGSAFIIHINDINGLGEIELPL
jgi:hypothetical protein